MSDPRLRAYTLEQLMAALGGPRRARAGISAHAVPADLATWDRGAVIAEVRIRQRAVYGTDDRRDPYEIDDTALLRDADAVVALFDATDVARGDANQVRLRTRRFGSRFNLCRTERFWEQPSGAFCSGVLVAPRVVATAGHCVDGRTVRSTRFVFGYRMADATGAVTTLSDNDVYRGGRLLGREETDDGADWALVELDRPVTGRRPRPIRRRGRIDEGEPVHVIGHPRGLPQKIAAGAAVRDNSFPAHFVANLDTYGGNSGSPVFNSRTHVVEGLLVRGENDFRRLGTCRVTLVCPTTGCSGEDCCRTTVFAGLVPTAQVGAKLPGHERW